MESKLGNAKRAFAAGLKAFKGGLGFRQTVYGQHLVMRVKRWASKLAVLCLLAILTGCVTTPEPWRADMQTPDGKVNGAVREFCYMHKIYLPIMDNNHSVIWGDPDWDLIAKRQTGVYYPIPLK